MLDNIRTLAADIKQTNKKNNQAILSSDTLLDLWALCKSATQSTQHSMENIWFPIWRMESQVTEQLQKLAQSS